MVQERRSRNVTIREVARAAGVGVGTVSRVLSGSPKVGEATRSLVNEVITRLDYRPSRVARSLAKGTTGTIGVLVPFFTQHYYLEILRGIQTAASESEYALVIHNVERADQLKMLLLSPSLQDRIDGLIVVAIDPAALAAAQTLKPFPLVGVDTELAGTTTIRPDHEAGIYLGTRHLVGHGHKRLAFIDRPQYPVSGTTTFARRNGFLRACREAGLDPEEQVIETGAYSAEGGYALGGEILARDVAPTAFVCASEVQSIGVLRAIAEAGLTIGRDLAVVGYHDVDLAQYACVTSVHIPAFEMGVQAVRSLVAAISSPDELPERIVFRPTLTVRASCGCAEESRLFGWPGFFPSAGA